MSCNICGIPAPDLIRRNKKAKRLLDPRLDDLDVYRLCEAHRCTDVTQQKRCPDASASSDLADLPPSRIGCCTYHVTRYRDRLVSGGRYGPPPLVGPRANAPTPPARGPVPPPFVAPAASSSSLFQSQVDPGCHPPTRIASHAVPSSNITAVATSSSRPRPRIDFGYQRESQTGIVDQGYPDASSSSYSRYFPSTGSTTTISNDHSGSSSSDSLPLSSPFHRPRSRSDLVPGAVRVPQSETRPGDSFDFAANAAATSSSQSDLIRGPESNHASAFTSNSRSQVQSGHESLRPLTQVRPRRPSPPVGSTIVFPPASAASELVSVTQVIAMLTLAAKQSDERRGDAVREKEEALRKVEQLQATNRKVEEERDEAVGKLEQRIAGSEAEVVESKKRINLLEERIELRDKRIDKMDQLHENLSAAQEQARLAQKDNEALQQRVQDYEQLQKKYNELSDRLTLPTTFELDVDEDDSDDLGFADKASTPVQIYARYKCVSGIYIKPRAKDDPILVRRQYLLSVGQVVYFRAHIMDKDGGSKAKQIMKLGIRTLDRYSVRVPDPDPIELSLYHRLWTLVAREREKVPRLSTKAERDEAMREEAEREAAGPQE